MEVTYDKPFVTDIASIEKTGEQTLRFTLKQPNTTFLTATFSNPRFTLSKLRVSVSLRRKDHFQVFRIGCASVLNTTFLKSMVLSGANNR